MSSTKRASTSALIRREDASRTHEDWAVLDVVSLKLKCNEYNIVASGKKDVLIDRLLDYFRTEKSPTPDPAERSTHEDSEEDAEEFELNLGNVDDRMSEDEIQNGGRLTQNNRKKSASSSQTKNKDGGRGKHGGKKSAVSKQRRPSPSSKHRQQKKTTSTNTKSSSPTPSITDFAIQSSQPPKQQHDQDLLALDNKMELILQTVKSTQGEMRNMQSQHEALQKRFDTEFSDVQQKQISVLADGTSSKKRQRPNDDNVSVNGDNNNNHTQQNNINAIPSATLLNTGTNYSIPIMPDNSDP